MGEILVYQHDAGKKGESEPLTVLDSYHPGSDRLTYYYWDDWMLSAHLFPKGETLTLGVAGAAGPRQLAQSDPAHRQTGVDLTPPSGEALRMDFHLGSATEYIFGTAGTFDAVWIDLYRSALPEFDILDSDFLIALKKCLKINGLAFIHLFRPANCFYRYDRASDPFEPLLARHLGSLGFRCSVLDHYSSQTWVIGDASDASLTKRISNEPRLSSGLLRNWLPYARAISRGISVEVPAPASVEALRSAFVEPVPSAVIERMGFDFCRDSSEWENHLGNPTFLINQHRRLAPSDAGSLILETLALWATAPGLELPPEARLYLREFARSRPDTRLAEFELRRPLLD